MRLIQSKNKYVIPKIPSLPEEYELGWDTGFYFPWLGIPYNPKHKGCNFFLQYKISGELGKKGKQYQFWNIPYYRFKIPYTTKDNENYVYDYNQFDRLKKLSKKYVVNYATNNFQSSNELFRFARNQNLADNVALLDVSTINQHHRYVTFTSTSYYFMLHSEIEKVGLETFGQLYERVSTSEPTELVEDVKYLSEYIINIEKEFDMQNEYGFGFRLKELDDLSTENKTIRLLYIIPFYLKLYLDAHWFRI